LWALFGSSIKILIKNAKIKKIVEYFLAVLLIFTAIIILFN
jgi:threonine/homoserine/homoserine lactone efflux protein